jgi:hypothetical protein
MAGSPSTSPAPNLLKSVELPGGHVEVSPVVDPAGAKVALTTGKPARVWLGSFRYNPNDFDDGKEGTLADLLHLDVQVLWGGAHAYDWFKAVDLASGTFQPLNTDMIVATAHNPDGSVTYDVYGSAVYDRPGYFQVQVLVDRFDPLAIYTATPSTTRLISFRSIAHVTDPVAGA